MLGGQDRGHHRFADVAAEVQPWIGGSAEPGDDLGEALELGGPHGFEELGSGVPEVFAQRLGDVEPQGSHL